jgi:hypothetical protein
MMKRALGANVRMGCAAALVLAALLAVAAAGASAAIYQCDQGGTKTFQDRRCDAESKPIDGKSANSAAAQAPAPNPQPAEKGLKERAEKADRKGVSATAERSQFRRECQSKLDRIEQERALLKSVSPAYRQSAQAAIDQQVREYAQSGC